MTSVLCPLPLVVDNLSLERGTCVKKATRFVIILVVALTCLVSSQRAAAQADSGRKVTTRVAAVYPELARRMHLKGVVKIQAEVRANGTVKSTKVLGGNPVLVDAAAEAVRKWKFEPSQSDTTEVVQVTFELK